MVRIHMESTLIFFPLSPFLYSPDNLLIPVLPILLPWRRSAPPSISDLVHLAQFFITSRACNLTIGTTATISNAVPSIITFTPLPSSINHLDSPPTRHNNSPIPLYLRHFRSFHSHPPRHHLLPTRQHLPCSPVRDSRGALISCL